MASPLQRALRGLYRALVPASAKNTLRLRLLFDERDKPPVEVRDFDARAVLVLAPHMDDEVVGCGGALRRHALAGAPVSVVFLTDGCACGDDGPDRGEVRKRESRRAAELLGLGELHFLDRPDGALKTDAALVQALRRRIEAARPEVLYLPSVLDTHDDHWATNLALAACLRDGLDLGAARLRQYEVWTPLVANAVADVSAVWDDKLAALKCFASQMEATDLVRLASGLNQYRSVHRGAGRGFAEAFYESDARTYAALLERVGERR